MDSSQLNKLTVAQLHEEIRNYGYSTVPKTKAECIKLILDHLEDNGPLQEVHTMQPQEAIGNAQNPSSSAQVFTQNSTQNNVAVNDQFQKSNEEYLPQFCTFMKDSMQRQQEMINQLVMALTLGQKPAQIHS